MQIPPADSGTKLSTPPSAIFCLSCFENILMGEEHAVLLLENIPALRRWGFYKAGSQIVKFSPATFMAGNYVLLQ